MTDSSDDPAKAPSAAAPAISTMSSNACAMDVFVPDDAMEVTTVSHRPNSNIPAVTPMAADDLMPAPVSALDSHPTANTSTEAAGLGRDAVLADSIPEIGLPKQVTDDTLTFATDAAVNAAVKAALELPVNLWGLDPLYWSYVKLFVEQITTLHEFNDLPESHRLFSHPILRVEVLGRVVAITKRAQHTAFVGM